jgi:hypothetical protein
MTPPPPAHSEPCSHMRGLLAAWQSNRLPRLLAWYVRYHVTHCTRCREAIRLFHALRERLKTYRGTAEPDADTLTPDRRNRLHAAMEEIEHHRRHEDADG